MVSPRKFVQIAVSLSSGEKSGPATGKMFAIAATAAAKTHNLAPKPPRHWVKAPH